MPHAGLDLGRGDSDCARRARVLPERPRLTPTRAPRLTTRSRPYAGSSKRPPRRRGCRPTFSPSSSGGRARSGRTRSAPLARKGSPSSCPARRTSAGSSIRLIPPRRSPPPQGAGRTEAPLRQSGSGGGRSERRPYGGCPLDCEKGIASVRNGGLRARGHRPARRTSGGATSRRPSLRPDKSSSCMSLVRHAAHNRAVLRRLGLVCALGRADRRELLERIGAARLRSRSARLCKRDRRHAAIRAWLGPAQPRLGARSTASACRLRPAAKRGSFAIVSRASGRVCAVLRS